MKIDKIQKPIKFLIMIVIIYYTTIGGFFIQDNLLLINFLNYNKPLIT